MPPQEDSNSTRKRSDDGASGPVGGERLEKARRSRGISLREIAKEEGMVELATAGVEQVVAGKTTLEEVFYKVSG